MKKIFDYCNYRNFLRDYYEENKKLKSSFSYRYLSQKAGITSPNFYQLVINGERNLTKATIFKTCKAFNLKDRECEYFENLVFYNQTKPGEFQKSYFIKLNDFQKSAKSKIISEDQYEYFHAWWHCVIRELVTFIDFKDDYSALAKKLTPHISAEQAQKSVELLVRLGFIKKENGRYVQTDPVVRTGNNLHSNNIRDFNFALINRFISNYEQRTSSERMCSTTILGVSEETFQCIVKKVRELRTDILDMARKDENPSRVYLMNINLISLSR